MPNMFQAATNQVSCNLEGEAVVLNLSTGVYYGFDSVGASIWTLLQKPRTVEEIKTILLQEYQVEAAVCEAHVLGFLDQLLAQYLIEVVEAKIPAALAIQDS